MKKRLMAAAVLIAAFSFLLSLAAVLYFKPIPFSKLVDPRQDKAAAIFSYSSIVGATPYSGAESFNELTQAQTEQIKERFEAASYRRTWFLTAHDEQAGGYPIYRLNITLYETETANASNIFLSTQGECRINGRSYSVDNPDKLFGDIANILRE